MTATFSPSVFEVGLSDSRQASRFFGGLQSRRASWFLERLLRGVREIGRLCSFGNWSKTLLFGTTRTKQNLLPPINLPALVKESIHKNIRGLVVKRIGNLLASIGCAVRSKDSNRGVRYFVVLLVWCKRFHDFFLLSAFAAQIPPLAWKGESGRLVKIWKKARKVLGVPPFSPCLENVQTGAHGAFFEADHLHEVFIPCRNRFLAVIIRLRAHRKSRFDFRRAIQVRFHAPTIPKPL